MDAIYYVYVYKDPRKEPPEPIYVGKGKGKRYRHHLSKKTNPILKRKLDHIRQVGLEPLIEKVQENLSAKAAAELEQDLIRQYGRICLETGTLCNITEGGEGTPGYKHREETLKIFSEQRKGRKQTEAQYLANCSREPQTEETRLKKSLANKGHRRHTPEQIEIIRQTNKTRVISDETRKKWSEKRRGVVQTAEHVQKVKDTKKQKDEMRKQTMTPEEYAAYKARPYVKNIGKKRSEETKKKMREAWIKRREKEGTEG